jgi:hypothetical protein
MGQSVGLLERIQLRLVVGVIVEVMFGDDWV